MCTDFIFHTINNKFHSHQGLEILKHIISPGETIGKLGRLVWTLLGGRSPGWEFFDHLQFGGKYWKGN